jgi:hypothetical protein
MSRTLGRKILTSIALIAIIAQSFSPYIAVLPQKAYAQDATPTVNQTTPTPNQITPTVTETPSSDQTITPTPTDTITPTPTDTPTPEVTSELTPTPTVDNTATATPTPTDNLSPPSDNSNNQPQVQGDSISVTPTLNATPSATPTPTETSTGNEKINMIILTDVSAPSIDLNTVVEGSASLITDKADYAPTDTALITGSNLISNTEYTLVISSSDNPVVNFSTNVTSDDKGTFVYAYQLDGKYRPNYKAELLDVDGNIVASTTFTDSASIYTQADFTAFDGVGNTDLGIHQANEYTLSSAITATYDSGTGTVDSPVLLKLTGYAPIVTPWFNPSMTTYDYVTIGIKKPAGFTGITIADGTAVFSTGVMRYDGSGNSTGGYLMGAGSTPLATTGAASDYLDFSFGANREYVKDGLVKLEVIWNADSAPEYFTIDVNGLHTSPVFNATTVAATGITLTDATLNGINGDTNATGHSFWVSTSTFDTSDLTPRAGLYWTDGIGAVAANTAFSAALSSVKQSTDLASIVVTPNTTYYYAAWSEVGGTWHPGAVLNFTTQPGPVFIDTNKNGVLDSGESSFLTIQSAINAAASGQTIHVTPGTYTEIGQIIISKNLSIVGANNATTIIKPAQDTGNSGDARGWFLVNSGISFTLKNVTLDGAGYKIWQAIRSHGPSDIENNIIKNILYDPSTSYEGVGIVVYDGFNSNILNNILGNIGREGIFVYGTGTQALVKGNTYSGKGTGNWLDYGIEVGSGGQATIEENNISNCKGIASVDGSTSAGVIGTTFYGSGTSIKLINNQIHDNSYGVGLGYGETDSTSVTQFDTNIFNNNTYDFDNGTVSNVDARNNTWSVSDQNNLDQIEAKINHYCSGSVYIHGACNVSDDYGPGFGMVQYKDIGTPNNLGWNRASQSVTPNEMPLDLVCNTGGVYTNENSVAQNWSTVSGANIKYQREVTFPNDSIAFFNPDGNNNYTPFSSFGAGDQGQWGTRVRAYVDANNNNVIDSGEEVSPWSNLCNINYDTTNPTVPVNGTPNNTTFATNNFDFNWDDSADNSPVTYLFQSSQNPASSGGVLTTGLWTSETLPSSMIHSAGVGDGTWYWQVRAIDAAGNKSAWSSVWKMMIDTVAPTLSEVTPISTPTNNSKPSYTFSSSEIGKITYGGSCLSVTTTAIAGNNTIVLKSLPDGGYSNCAVTVTDAAGNTSSPLDISSFTIDTTAPVVAITSPTTTYVSGTAAIDGTVTDLNPDHYYLVIENSGGNIIAGPQTVSDKTSFKNKLLFTWDTTKASDGKYTIDLEARDAADNKDSGSTATLQITVDNTAPATPSADPIADNYTSDQLVTLISTDSASGLANIFYTIDGSTPDNYSTPYTTPITVDNDITIKAIAYDNAGNASDVLEATYGISITPAAAVSLSTSFGGAGDGRSDGLSSCPSCTQAPQGNLGGNVLGASITPPTPQGSALLVSAPLQQTVLGAATESASPTPSINPSPTGKTLISSSANWVLNHIMLSFLILIIIALIAYFIYRKKRKK